MEGGSGISARRKCPTSWPCFGAPFSTTTARLLSRRAMFTSRRILKKRCGGAVAVLQVRRQLGGHHEGWCDVVWVVCSMGGIVALCDM